MAKQQFEGVFEVDQVKPRKMRNGNRMQITLEAPYDEKQFKKLVHFNFLDVHVFLEEFDDGQQELDGIEGAQETPDEQG